MSSIPSRYRVVNFIGGRILEARELIQLQEISQGIDVLGNGTSTSYVEEEVTYRQGAMLNGTIVVNGTSVTVQPSDGVNPIMVFVRDRWESFQSTELTPITLTAGQTSLYLNWQILVITSAQDPTLIDGATGQATAEMGQLSLQISATDTSTTAPVAGVQLYKNTQTIKLCNFTYANGLFTVVPLDNVNPNSLANNVTSGFVKLTTGTSSGVAVAANDPGMTNARDPIVGSVVDASVRVPVSPGGSNSDGTPVYNLTSDTGGVSATKIILTATTQLLSDAWTLLQSNFNSLLSRYNSHQGTILGLSYTHPIPTPAQVGAAPLSHVGLPLNLPTSHPATVTQASGGFVLNRGTTATGAGGDPGFGIFAGSTIVAGLMHNGDVYSSYANTINAFPGGSGITYSGALGYAYNRALILAEHVNQVSHANPHGLALSDLGGQSALGFTPVQQGTGIDQGTNTVRLGWDGGGLRATVDVTDLGEFVFSSQLAPYALTTTVNSDFTTLQANIAALVPIGGAGWTKLPNGLIMQWGRIAINQSSTYPNGTFTLPVSFTNPGAASIVGCAMTLANGGALSNSSDVPIIAMTIIAANEGQYRLDTNAGFNIYGVTISWQAIGF